MEAITQRCAVVAVHLQGHIVGPDGAFASFFRDQVEQRSVLEVIERLLNAARAAGRPVIYTRVAWQPDYSDLNANSPLLQIAQQAGALTEGDPKTDIVAEVAPQDGDVVHTHQRIGGFNANLDQQLRDRDIDTVYVCGVATNASVEGTARGLSDAGYRVVIVEDACSAATPEAHQASIASMGLIGEIVDSATAVAALRGQPVDQPVAP